MHYNALAAKGIIRSPITSFPRCRVAENGIGWEGGDGRAQCGRSVICDCLVCLFVCASYISGTAERICAKYTETTCLVPRSDECYLSVCLSLLSVFSVTLVYCGQTAGWINMKLGMQVGLGPGHIVLDGNPAAAALRPPKGPDPQFSAHICCGQMAGWIKMPLGREVGISPSDIALNGDPAPLPQRGAETPIFGTYLLLPNGRMDQEATW